MKWSATTTCRQTDDTIQALEKSNKPIDTNQGKMVPARPSPCEVHGPCSQVDKVARVNAVKTHGAPSARVVLACGKRASSLVWKNRKQRLTCRRTALICHFGRCFIRRAASGTVRTPRRSTLVRSRAPARFPDTKTWPQCFPSQSLQHNFRRNHLRRKNAL